MGDLVKYQDGTPHPISALTRLDVLLTSLMRAMPLTYHQAKSPVSAFYAWKAYITITIRLRYDYDEQEAQLPLRNRASAMYFFVAKLLSIA